jgi:hypothetical protein
LDDDGANRTDEIQEGDFPEFGMKYPMRKLITSILVTFVVLLGTAGESFALPPCPDNNPSGEFSCFGTVIWNNGNKYVGAFRNGLKHGKGTATFASGSKYIGEFKDNEYHGQGTYISHNGNKYVGEYRNNKKNGQGTYTFANGNKYIGEFRNGVRHGQGIDTTTSGIVKEGIWENDMFKYAQKVSPTVIAEQSTPTQAQKEPKYSLRSNTNRIVSGSSVSVIARAANGVITGNYRSREGEEFNFDSGGTFTYKLYTKDRLHDGAYEGSSCAVTSRKTNEVLHQGNFLFYFNGTSCCYKVKLVRNKLLVMSRVWSKDSNERSCPNSNLRVISNQ